jgi:hypothetical protein
VKHSENARATFRGPSGGETLEEAAPVDPAD